MYDLIREHWIIFYGMFMWLMGSVYGFIMGSKENKDMGDTSWIDK